MQVACAEARRWLGATYPNPPVGAVALDAQGHIIALAAHEKAGAFHAEAVVIEQCRARGVLDRVHTLCVTLEPCNHHGRTPPCSETIIKSGIRHIVVGTRDPNPRVAGGGIERLREAGLDVMVGVEEDLCRQLIYAFSYSVQNGRPWLTVKRAFDENGSMIPPVGQKTFADPSSLVFAHQLRKRSDAILTGSGTILADDPAFTVRHVPDYRDRTRVLAILDRRRRVSERWLDAARGRGLLPLVYTDIREAVDDLAHREIREVLVEAGPKLSDAVLATDLWALDVRIHKANPDRIETVLSPLVEVFPESNLYRWENVCPNDAQTPV